MINSPVVLKCSGIWELFLIFTQSTKLLAICVFYTPDFLSCYDFKMFIPMPNEGRIRRIASFPTELARCLFDILAVVFKFLQTVGASPKSRMMSHTLVILRINCSLMAFSLNSGTSILWSVSSV